MLYNIMALGEDTAILKKIKPGQEIRFLFEDGEFEALQYDVDLTDTLYIKKLGDIYSANLLEKELEIKVKTASGTINDSLFLAGKKSGLSDNMIMQMINLYGWDIDFAMEVRQAISFMSFMKNATKMAKKFKMVLFWPQNSLIVENLLRLSATHIQMDIRITTLRMVIVCVRLS